MGTQLASDPRKEFTLLFAADRSSTVPRLKACGRVPVAPEELQPWEDELNGAHEEIVTRGSPQTFRFRTPLSKMPRDYRLEVNETDANGVFAFVLTPIDDNLHTAGGMAVAEPAWALTPEPAGPPRPTDWAATFVQELKTLLHETVHDPAKKAGIRLVLAELRDWAERHPEQLLLVLAAGYLQFTQRRRTGSERELAFVNASYAIDELCAVQLDPPEAPSPNGGPRLYQRNVMQLFEILTRHT